MSEIFPAKGKILVEIQAQTHTAGGIFIPDSANASTPTRAVVVKVGKPKEDTETVDFEVGDFVHFKPYVGDEVKFEGNTYKVLNFEDILIIEKGDAQ